MLDSPLKRDEYLPTYVLPLSIGGVLVSGYLMSNEFSAAEIRLACAFGLGTV